MLKFGGPSQGMRKGAHESPGDVISQGFWTVDRLETGGPCGLVAGACWVPVGGVREVGSRTWVQNDHS